MNEKNARREVDDETRYNESVKRLLGQKYVLAHILIHTIDEFKGMAPKDVVECIVGEPKIGGISEESELADAKSEEGQSENPEEVIEISYDVSFSVRMKSGISPLIVNVEDIRTKKEYQLYNRTPFYAFHLLASQKVTDYDDIQPVYAIGVCVGMKENSLSYIHPEISDMLDTSSPSVQNYLINEVMIGVADGVPENDDEYKLHRLLGTLFWNRISGDEKLRIIETEYNIPVTEDMKREIQTMSDLAERIEERLMKYEDK